MTFSPSLPKISCVTVTEGRPALLRKAVNCYLQQTYENRELIVLSQGSERTNEEIEKYLKSLERADILFITADQKLTLGAMRNLSIELTTGEVICQWDDDDLYHPLRLVTQLYALQDYGMSACFYTQHLKYFSTTKELYWVDWSNEKEASHRYLTGSAMFYKSIFHQAGNCLYPEDGAKSNREEDLDLLERLLDSGKIAGIDNGYQYIYVYHGQNTYSLPHHELVLKKRLMSADQLRNQKTLLDKTFKLAGIKDEIIVRSLEETAYEYKP